MAIASGQRAPSGGADMVGRALQDLLTASDAPGGHRPIPEATLVSISQPVPVFRLTTEHLANPRDIDSAEQVGWKYVVRRSSDRFGVADLAGIEDGQLRFCHLSHSRHARAFVEGLHQAQEIAANVAQDCEIRSLEVPALYVSMIWVTSQPAAFVPFILPPRFPAKILTVDYDMPAKLLGAAEAHRRRREEKDRSPPP